LAINGKLIIVGASDEMIQVPPNLFISGRRSIIGWASGTSIDSQDTMMSGKVRFRAVLTTTGH
jgi:D-arabinose 1-dehydrogenase-like Zn-dependent alcohol dehydrogenase